MYKKKINTYLINNQGKFLITDGNTLYEVNETGARIFDLCNGKYCNKDIAIKISKKFNMEVNSVQYDVDLFVLKLEEYGFVQKQVTKG